jgi:hypothetical protein
MEISEDCILLHSTASIFLFTWASRLRIADCGLRIADCGLPLFYRKLLTMSDLGFEFIRKQSAIRNPQSAITTSCLRRFDGAQIMPVAVIFM